MLTLIATGYSMRALRRHRDWTVQLNTVEFPGCEVVGPALATPSSYVLYRLPNPPRPLLAEPEGG